MKIKADKIVTLVSVLLIVCLFAFFLKDILIPFIKLEIANDMEGAKTLLRSKGILGFFAVILIEALQMVVIFIPAEFIQISSGLSYPLPVAVILCDLGVCLGATIIYVLVRTFKFNNETYNRQKKRIDALSNEKKNKKSKSTMLLLYFLFLMPLIPFGAICYYGSSTRIGYKKYILTVATGVIPSILTSNLMGTAAKAFIMNSLPLPPLLLIIVVLAAILFILIFIFLDRVYFKENDKTPDSVLYAAFFRAVHIFCKNRRRVHFENQELLNIEGPYILLCNHPSMFDFYYVKRFLGDKNAAYVVNKYYATRPILRKLYKKGGFITKKLFSTDLDTIGGLIKMTRAGYSAVIFPEGRLSLDGSSYPVTENGGGLYKKLNVDIVLVKIRGAYYSKPKWRKAFFKTDVYVSAERFISREEAKNYSPEELDRIISETLEYDETKEPENVFRKKNKAKGLERALYRCADCGALYTTRGAGNRFFCTGCGAERTFDDHYKFSSGNIKTIHEYYEKIKETERKDLDTVKLEAAVKTKIFDAKGAVRLRERGFCTLDKNEFTYSSDSVKFSIGTEKLHALPFSAGEEFELYYKDEQYYFYPEENRDQVARWGLIADLIYERNHEKQ
ncbi:MAG: VTT domain-containing protein [Clostridia bacterium]|nr:VTT domain-containing protein [Clostridia bacterium]